MFRKDWKDAAFWRWWWRRGVSTDLKVFLGLALVAGLLVGGYFASGWLTGASASSSDGTYVLETTVRKIVTVKEHGRTIVKRVPVVVRRTVVKSHTAIATVVATHVVTAPGGLRYVTTQVVRYVPVVKRTVVTTRGKTTTLTETRLVPTIKTQTQTLTNVVTNEQTVTNQNTVVVNHTSTATSTVVQPVTTVQTRTVTRTETVVQTVTTPPTTVTRTETLVTTVTLPGGTTTITITVPGGTG